MTSTADPAGWQRDLLVLAGGAIGTLGRAGVAEVVAPGADGWPWATFVVNVLGTVLLAVLVRAAVVREPDDPWVRFLGTGVLGSFTTFSAFAVEARTLGLGGTGLTYAVVSVVAGVATATIVLRWPARSHEVAT